jgi:hypothetical protein
MTETRATRATVTLGSIIIDGFMLPDGSYRMSLTQAAETVDLGVQNASDFLRSKALKSLAGEGYTPQTFEIETDDQIRGQGRFRGLPLEIVRKYWLYQASRGNKKAIALCDALMAETLERRFDRAFNVTRPEDEWDRRLSEAIVNQLESDLSSAFEEADTALSREKLLEQQLRELGVEPWALPGDEGEA